MLEFLVDIFVVFGGGFPTDSRHSNKHQLCPSPSRHISVLIRSGIHTVLSAGKKQLASQFNFTYRYIDDTLSTNNPDFANYLGQMYPADFEIKHRCFLLGSTPRPVDREGRSAAHFPLQQT